MINLYFSSSKDGFLRINNIFAGNTLNMIKVSLDSFKTCFVEFYPTHSDLLPIVTQLEYGTNLYTKNAFIEILKYDSNNYEVVFLDNKIFPPSSYEIIYSKGLFIDNSQITVSVVETTTCFVIFQDYSKVLNHKLNLTLSEVNIQSINIDNNSFIKLTSKCGDKDFLLIANSAFDIIYEGLESHLENNNTSIISLFHHNDMRRHITKKTYAFKNGLFVLERQEKVNDSLNNISNGDILRLKFLFIESVVSGFKNEALGYLDDELKNTISFETICDFLLPFKSVKQNIFTDNNKDSLFLIQKNNNKLIVNLLDFEIKNNKIADINIT